VTDEQTRQPRNPRRRAASVSRGAQAGHARSSALVAVDMTLAGEPLGLETARDLIREVEHAYPELAAEWIESE
jgi:hypothetical protein